LIKNSQPFGKKISENRRGGFFWTHTVGLQLNLAHVARN